MGPSPTFLAFSVISMMFTSAWIPSAMHVTPRQSSPPADHRQAMALVEVKTTKLDLDAAQLVKLMKRGSVATRIESEGFIQALVEVKTKLGLDAAQLVTFMSNSSAARIMDLSYLPNAFYYPRSQRSQCDIYVPAFRSKELNRTRPASR